MTQPGARSTATRADAIAVAAERFSGEDILPHWAGNGAINRNMLAVCEVLAAVFGTDDQRNYKSEIWNEINIAFEHQGRRATAEQIARDQVEIDYSAAKTLAAYLPNDNRREELLTALTMAALAGMEAAK